MKRLMLIRHGESTWNRENRVTGWTDVKLTQTGVALLGGATLINITGESFEFADRRKILYMSV